MVREFIIGSMEINTLAHSKMGSNMDKDKNSTEMEIFTEVNTSTACLKATANIYGQMVVHIAVILNKANVQVTEYGRQATIDWKDTKVITQQIKSKAMASILGTMAGLIEVTSTTI